MPKLNLPPTKSSLLTLRRQLAFAEEGYDLLEQKRQILAFELMSRLARVRTLEREVAEATARARARLEAAVLESGSLALERAGAGGPLDHELDLTTQHLPGLRAPRVTVRVAMPAHPLGLGGVSGQAELARLDLLRLLPLLGELAVLQTTVERLARELQRTQRRCNALSRVFIPADREAIAYITAALEEREREAFVILRRIRDRARSAEAAAPTGASDQATTQDDPARR